MPLELSQLYELKDGRRAYVTVGPLAPEAINYLGAKLPDVNLSKDSFEHIRQDHPDVSLFELLRAPVAIREGMMIGVKNRVIISYQIPDDPMRYKAVVKCVGGGYDLWLVTFHRTRPRQTAAIFRRGKLLKKHAFRW